jgi:predicted MFS family arabinose efflux permease
MILASIIIPIGIKIVFWTSSGFFLAPTFPTLIAWITSLSPEHGGTLAGIIFTAGTAGILLSNYILGISKMMYGATVSQYIFVLFTAAMMVTILLSFSSNTKRQ